MISTKSRAVRLRRKPSSSTTRCGGLAVFTALDGALLDSKTFDAGASMAIVHRLHAAGVPIVPMTVMTLEEVTPVARELGLGHAMVIEAGGAIARWRGGGWDVEPCGPPAETFLDVVREIEDRSGARLLVYSVMPEDDAARLSGLPHEMFVASTHRCFSEPFLIEEGDAEAVSAAAAALGFSIRRGRRMLHLCRACDEGHAFLRLREELGCGTAIAVGGSPIDAEFLTRAEIPIVIPRSDGTPDTDLLALVPNARVAPAAGPRGWAAAIEQALHEAVSRKAGWGAAVQPPAGERLARR